MNASHKFDQVVIRRADGGEDRLSPEAFAAIPLSERVRIVSKGLATFFKAGQQVPAVEALRK